MFEAVKAMDKFKVGALMVIDNSKLVGVISERDYTRKVVLKDRSSKSTKVSEIMSHKIAQVGPEAGIEKCMDIMGKRRIRHLPVVENDRMVGFVSIGDLVKYRFDKVEQEAEEMRSYIQTA